MSMPAAGSQIERTGVVTLTVTDGCNNSNSVTFNVTVPEAMPEIRIEGETRTCPNGEVTLTAVIAYNGNLTYIWEGADALPTAAGQATLTAAAACGDKTQARVVATNDNGCPSTSEWFILTAVDTDAPEITAPQRTMEAETLGNCRFALPDVTPLVSAVDGCTPDNLIVITQDKAAGTAVSENTEVTVTASDGCGNRSTVVILVTVPADMPQLTIEGERSTCPNTEVSLVARIAYDGTLEYTWNNASGQDEEAMVTSPAACGGSVTVTAMAVNEYGCYSRAEFTVTSSDTEKPFIGAYTAEQAAERVADCQFVVPELTDIIAAVATDNCTDINDLVITQSVAAGTEITGNTPVTVSVEDGCGNVSTAVITVTATLSSPTLTVTAPTSLCGPVSVDVADYVTNDGGWKVEYYNDWQLTEPAATTVLRESGLMFIVARDESNGCRSQVYSVDLTINELTIEVADPMTIAVGDPAEIWIEGVGEQADQYVYDIHLNGNGVDGVLENNRYTAVEYPDQSTVYVLTARNGECEQTVTVTVSVSVEHKEEHSFFTPNGDGINEEWCFSNMRVSPSAKLQIFDRYGKCVFESTVSEGCWDGYYRDHVMNSGDYWYVVTDDRTGERYSGHLTLKR